MDIKNRLNEYSDIILSVDEAIDLMLCGGNLYNVRVSDDEERLLYNENAYSVLRSNAELLDNKYDVTVEEYHINNTSTWFTPDRYKALDVLQYVLSLCVTQAEIERVQEEYKLFKERELDDVLRFFIYLVDYLRENNIVWGVGRGSSVASYILFLIGVHKIDSIRYSLDIKEFLK